MPLNAKIELTGGHEFVLTGLLAVDEKKLLALDDLEALEFFRSGELGWVYCHLMSIGTLYQFDAVAKVEGDPDEAEGGQEKTHAKPKRKRGLRSNLQ